jgi:release factor glutamine methyltransferase
VTALLRHAETVLSACGIPTPRLDAEVLLAHAMRTERSGVFARLADRVDPLVAEHFTALLERRRRREPVAYITGYKEFHSLQFAVTPAVLIPRPETEHVVDAVCEMLGTQTGARVCEVGTGSGCIAIALACDLPRVRVVATDLSRTALDVARANARAHGVGERVRFVASDLFDGVGRAVRFDAIVSNPPYLCPGDLVSPEVAWEPRMAFGAGADGLAVVRRLLAAAPERLAPGGALVMEFGRGQADAIVALVTAAGFATVAVRDDLAGIPRVLTARRPPAA